MEPALVRSPLSCNVAADVRSNEVVMVVSKKTDEESDTDASGDDKSSSRRQISGNMPYTSSIGVFKRTLQKIIESERPAKFNKDFLNTVLGISGGASMPVIPILKKAGLLSDNGTPASLYADFQTEGGRANAALQALKNAFGEIFKRNQYAHKADRSKLVDVVVGITGLPKDDSIVGYIVNTFQAFQDYAKDARETDLEIGPIESQPTPKEQIETFRDHLRIAYQFNIVLPESTNIEVFNAIFKSLRDNLIR
jgi:hypothetical protein